MDERYDNVENLISPESIQAMQNALLTMQNALKSFSKAVNEALVDAKNENHETATKLLEAYQTACEVKKREYDVGIFSSPEEMYTFQARKSTLASVDPKLAEDFHWLVYLTKYHFELIYKVFMAHGSGAKEIIEHAARYNLSSARLELYSDIVLENDAEKLRKEIGNQPVININRTRKEVKLPRKLRNGWS